jgi:hypothetical protein
MKRACFVWMAIVAILLVCPTVTPSAKSHWRSEDPGTHAITPYDQPVGGGVGNTGGENEGDGDDLAGSKNRPTGGTSSAFNPGRSLVKAWWMYFNHYVLIRMH